MLNSSENFFNCKEICYKSVKFHHYSSLWNSKSVRYIRKFVKTLKFCKDNLKIFPGTQKKLRYIRYVAISMFVLNKFYCTCIMMYNTLQCTDCACIAFLPMVTNHHQYHSHLGESYGDTGPWHKTMLPSINTNSGN